MFSRFICVIWIFIMFAGTSYSFDGSGDVINVIKKDFNSGEIGGVSRLFPEHLRIVVLDKKKRCGPSEAERIIQSFFQGHESLNFRVKHRGGDDDTRYVIGQLKTINEVYRVYFLIYRKQKQTYIKELRIKNE